MGKFEGHALHQKGFFGWKTQVIEYRGLISAGNTAKHHLQTFPSLQQSCLVQLCLSLVFAILEYLHICSGEACCSCRYRSAWEPGDVSQDCIISWWFIILQGKKQAKLFNLPGKQKNKGVCGFSSCPLRMDASVTKEAPSPWNKILWNKVLWPVTHCCPASSSWDVQSCSAVGLGFVCKETLSWNVVSWGIKQGKCCQQHCLGENCRRMG